MHIKFADRSEEYTSELQSPCNLVCRLLLEKKKNTSEPQEQSKHAGRPPPVSQDHLSGPGAKSACATRRWCRAPPSPSRAPCGLCSEGARARRDRHSSPPRRVSD